MHPDPDDILDLLGASEAPSASPRDRRPLRAAALDRAGQLARRRKAVGPGALLAAVLLAAAFGPIGPWAGRASADRPLDRAALAEQREAQLALSADVATPAAAPATTQPPTTTTTVAPTTTTTTPPPASRFTMEPYRGLGAWLDVYDWSTTFSGSPVGPEAVDLLAAHGTQTLYIQASKWNSPTLVLEPERLQAFIDRAHHHGMSVVGWYLPTFEDPGLDRNRMNAIAAMPVDGLAIDLEARNVPDIAERNRRMVELSSAMRHDLPGAVLGAIPLEPVLMEDVNPSYWPSYPWAGLAPSFDVWLPMGYWTNRQASSPWRNAHTYTAANIDRIRAHIGQPEAPVHPIGGIGDKTTVDDLKAFLAAATERGSIGGSIYDYRTTQAPHWAELHPFTLLRNK